jgi:hypothetical protein
MAPSERPPRVDEPPPQERRSSERLPTILSCPYELTRVSGSDTVELSEGVTLALNISAGGMLLLMPQSPGERNVFEVHVPSPAKPEKTTKLVEVCWTRKFSFGVGTKVHLVGVKSLFEPPGSS